MNNYEEIYMYLKVLVASCGGDEGWEWRLCINI